jgi:hypothetical protein
MAGRLSAKPEMVNFFYLSAGLGAAGVPAHPVAG